MKLKLLNGVENVVPKGEIAHDEKFLLAQCFQKSSAAPVSTASKCVCRWKSIKMAENSSNMSILIYQLND